MKKIQKKIIYDHDVLLSKDELMHHQFLKLKSTIHHAYSTLEFYNTKYKNHGVHPDDFKRLEDISKFPFMSKEDLRVNYPFNLFAKPMKDIVRIHSSSGTTGKATVVGYTQKDIDTWAYLMARCIGLAGGNADDIMHISYGYGLFTGGLGAHYGAEKLGCAVIPASGGFTTKQVDIILDFKPDIIMVTPSYMFNIIEEIEKRGINPRDTSLRIGIFGAEPWGNEMKGIMEEKLGINAINIYGLSEMIGPGVACEILEDRGDLYIWEDHFYPEIVDPTTFNPLDDGEQGELVFSNLTREAFPMIRYRTKDLTSLYQGNLLNMRKMKRITGRVDDMMIIRGVNVFPTQIEEILLKIPVFEANYQIEISREKFLDILTLNVEKSDNTDDSAVNKAIKELLHNIKSGIGISVEIKVHNKGSIEKSQGKAKRVIDKREIK